VKGENGTHLAMT